MRLNLLTDSGNRASCTFLGIALMSLLTPAVGANRNPPGGVPLSRAHGVAAHHVHETRLVAAQAITGIVTDESNSGLPGVSVLEKGTNNGVVSDADGKYSINVKDGNSVLVFSFIGYVTQEVKVGSGSALDIKLDVSSQELNDVVVVGYGTQKRSELTNAVVQTTGAEIKNPVRRLCPIRLRADWRGYTLRKEVRHLVSMTRKSW